ncbi:MAG: UrcA family protein [Proteobacteria bacterium]|nr:MAG: UrcA family protein [Pseudomonadota bacterium]
MKTAFRFAAIAAALGTSLALSVPAAAETGITEVVKYYDLNLTQPTDAQKLYRRLQGAAWRVCRDTVSGSGAAAMLQQGTCIRTLVESAVHNVNKPVLTALHEGKAAEADLTASR